MKYYIIPRQEDGDLTSIDYVNIRFAHHDKDFATCAVDDNTEVHGSWKEISEEDWNTKNDSVLSAIENSRTVDDKIKMLKSEYIAKISEAKLLGDDNEVTALQAEYSQKKNGLLNNKKMS